MTRIPSSADLAALRRSLYWMASGPSDNANAAGWHGPMIHPDAGAWPGELRDGIGYRTDWADGYASDTAALFYRHSIARREASALRSRAYAAEAPFRILAGDPGWLDPMDFPELPE